MTNYSEAGSYTAYVGLLVAVLAHFGLIVSTNDALAVLGGVVALFGVIKQHVTSNRVAIAAGLK